MHNYPYIQNIVCNCLSLIQIKERYYDHIQNTGKEPQNVR